MLETHYIDHLELLEVTHGDDQVAYPDSKGRPIVAGTAVTPVKAVDQDGRNILSDIAYADGQVWSATAERLAKAGPEDFHDSLDIQFDLPENSGEIARVRTMRHRMLNTVLLYDVML